MLIDDTDFNLPVFVGKSSCGLLKGSLGGIKILYIENSENIQNHDKVWIKDPSFTFTLYIGEVRQVHKDPDSLFCDVDVRLLSENPLLHKLFIVE